MAFLMARMAGFLGLALIATQPAALFASEAPDWLVVVQGEVEAVNPGTMTLAVPPTALTFTDRPQRLVRFVDLERFLTAAWSEGGDLARDPPNASLVNEADNEVNVIEITGMKVDGGLLSVSYSLLEGEAPEAGDRIALTIDAFPTQVNGQITDIVGTYANDQMTD
jgi:hypothetical protein